MQTERPRPQVQREAVTLSFCRAPVVSTMGTTGDGQLQGRVNPAHGPVREGLCVAPVSGYVIRLRLNSLLLSLHAAFVTQKSRFYSLEPVMVPARMRRSASFECLQFHSFAVFFYINGTLRLQEKKKRKEKANKMKLVPATSRPDNLFQALEAKPHTHTHTCAR